MALLKLDISDFRNLFSAKLELIPEGFNFIYGDNGSGKTSLLEAVYYLSLGRSFRSSMTKRIISDSADKFSIFAHLVSINNQTTSVGLERHLAGDMKIRISGKDVRSIVELAELLPIQLINVNCFNLLEGPGFRRKYLDWGCFYLTSEFYRVWRQYEAALKQRNAALRNQLSKNELEAWNVELIRHANSLNIIRSEYVNSLTPILINTLKDLLQINHLEFGYQSGWGDSDNFGKVLAENLEKDRQLGYTQMGPHRADLKITINGVPAKDILSRGQQKLFVCAMILAQGILLKNHTNKAPIYLVDDLPSELDFKSRANLMSLLARQQAQVFVTAVESDTLVEFLKNGPAKMFHVEHGKIIEACSLLSS